MRLALPGTHERGVGANSAQAGPSVQVRATEGEVRRMLDASGTVSSSQAAITRIVRRPSPWYTSAALEEIDVEHDDGRTLRLMLKGTSRAAMHDEARRVKPRFVHDPRREIEVYRRVLARHEGGTPVCVGSVIDERTGRYWLLLERVAGIELWQSGDLAVWQGAARWLAWAHIEFGNAGVVNRAEEVRAIRCDRRYYRRWLVRARRLLRATTVRRAAMLVWLSTRHDAVVERLLALPTTFTHGEFYASNVRVQHTHGGLRICPVDWEMAAVAPGLMDVAALTAGWPDDEGLTIAEAYRDELARLGRPWPDAGSFREALTCCRVQIAVQWLGWFGDRSAPAAYARNWLEEAVSVVSQID